MGARSCALLREALRVYHCNPRSAVSRPAEQCCVSRAKAIGPGSWAPTSQRPALDQRVRVTTSRSSIHSRQVCEAISGDCLLQHQCLCQPCTRGWVTGLLPGPLWWVQWGVPIGTLWRVWTVKLARAHQLTYCFGLFWLWQQRKQTAGPCMRPGSWHSPCLGTIRSCGWLFAMTAPTRPFTNTTMTTSCGLSLMTAMLLPRSIPAFCRIRQWLTALNWWTSIQSITSALGSILAQRKLHSTHLGKSQPLFKWSWWCDPQCNQTELNGAHNIDVDHLLLPWSKNGNNGIYIYAHSVLLFLE